MSCLYTDCLLCKIRLCTSDLCICFPSSFAFLYPTNWTCNFASFNFSKLVLASFLVFFQFVCYLKMSWWQWMWCSLQKKQEFTTSKLCILGMDLLWTWTSFNQIWLSTDIHWCIWVIVIDPDGRYIGASIFIVICNVFLDLLYLSISDLHVSVPCLFDVFSAISIESMTLFCMNLIPVQEGKWIN